jgi:hypothetical protein
LLAVEFGHPLVSPVSVMFDGSSGRTLTDSAFKQGHVA